MNNVKLICKLINEKRAHLISYEAFSNKLIHCDMDTFNDVLDQRELIIQSINAIDLKLITILKQTENKEIRNIIQSKALMSEISDELMPMYYGIKSIHESLENIQVIEHVLHNRLNAYQEEIRMDSKEKKNVEKIKKYFETYETEIDEMDLLMSKSSKA